MSEVVAPSAPKHPVTDRVREAMAVSLRGCEELLPEVEWLAKLARAEATGVPLRIKLGLDPTAPDIHLGHTVVLNKMRQLQDMGHTVIFLIGDFTSMIGDPSGRNNTRPPLTREQIETNARTYYQQASLVLDPDRTEIRYNSEWSDPLGARGMIELASRYTVARMMERNDFAERFRAGLPISVHELLYPLMQAEYGQESQCILTMPLLEGLDGIEKMSKSKGNYIGISEPANTMFAKLLSISDPLMWRYFTLLSFRSEREIELLAAEVAAGRNPKEAKVLLAREVCTRFHSAAAADAAERDFELRARGGVPDEIPDVVLGGAPLSIGVLLKQACLAPSSSEALRLVDAGGVRVDGSVVGDRALRLAAGTYVVQVGKRRFARVTLSP
jgi:tyrosyl-tRNA synthetase